ncbi:MAG: hypothetical protein QOE54_5790 [Streptosporangiaceae bacterium]|nr:hypothetical protein [Streptosporangiaceae bacterium]MDX6433424.1 hypothetical protein [Streptosporangiaceae bacterium]
MTSLAAPRVQPEPVPTTPACHENAAIADTQGMVSRLALEFPAVDRQIVDRQVRDTWNCATHLSADVTPDVVEELAREHLIALDGSLDLIRPVRAHGRRREAAG